MFEAIVVERGERREEAPKPGTVDAVEVVVDQHFGVRVEAHPGGWSTISFREGGGWTLPVDTRTLVRAQFRREGLRATE